MPINVPAAQAGGVRRRTACRAERACSSVLSMQLLQLSRRYWRAVRLMGGLCMPWMY